jgi:hypothetical protein
LLFRDAPWNASGFRDFFATIDTATTKPGLLAIAKRLTGADSLLSLVSVFA